VADTALTSTGPGAAAIPTGRALATWFVSWLVGPLFAAGLVLAAVNGGFDDPSIPSIVAGTAAGWIVFVVALWWVSTRSGSGDFLADYAVRWRPLDLVGVPAGVLTQLVLLPALYYPLQQWFPDAFSDSDLEERAQDLVDKAGGAKTVLLVLLVAVGAPIVEELVYRGLLQRSVARSIGAVPSLLVVSLLFAGIHISPVEIPGLFLAGLVFGTCLVLTGRLGPAILAHAAFNATALVVLLS
jgi:uncharacterized protein